jgi:exopolyphosphatase/guanosine-5'-triphosphate,3'-diphosphate pyrophosphatase
MPQYAAVDIGSNSVRLLVAEAAPDHQVPRVTRLAEERQVTRLGASVFETGSISESAMNDTCQVLERMRAIWQRYEVVGIRVVATSATRDANNQAEFLERATAAIGANVETISGQEEARLVQLGVQTVWPHPHERILIVDVGGGSAELILADHARMVAGYSRPLGAVRLQTTFLQGNDPPTAQQLERMRGFIQQKLEVALPRLAGREFARVISTSASAAAVVCAVNRIARTKREAADRMKASRAQIRRLFQELSTKTLAERRRVPGIGPRRAEIVVPGAAVFLAVLESLQLPSMYYSSAGVRDGIIADLSQRRVGREFSALTAEQRHVVETLAKRYGVDVRHARKLADFAHSLYTSLEPLHRLPPHFGKMLEAASYLCDIGHFISDTSHHKHSAYIVANSDLAAFTEQERNLIALLCRYHRKALPNPKHSEYQLLPPEAKRALLLLIPILRMVDGLDRSRDQRVESVACELPGDSVILKLRSHGETNLEQWSVEQVAAPFRQIYQRELSVQVEKL